MKSASIPATAVLSSGVAPDFAVARSRPGRQIGARGTLLGVTAALALFGGALPASALTIVDTWTGTFSSGTDYAGLFGLAGSDLAGTPFTLVSSLNPAKGVFFDGGFGSGLYGGNCCGTVSPGGAVLTIKGVSLSIDGQNLADLENYVSGVGTRNMIDDIEQVSTSGATTTFRLASLYSQFSPNVPPTILTPYAGPCGPSCGGSVDFETTVGSTTTFDVEGQLDPTRLTVQILSGVPEPGVWAMLFAGFAGIGAALRRRRKTVTMLVPAA